MRLREEDLDSFRRVDADYRRAITALDVLKLRRDDAVLRLLESATVREVAEATGLSPGRVQQIATRARAEVIAAAFSRRGPGSAGPATGHGPRSDA
jgi:hypothetical protein